MLIETYHDAYAVVQHYYTGLHLDHYVCRRRSDRGLYTVIRVRNKKITAQILGFICEQAHNKKFVDLKEQFTADGDLHVVFACEEGTPLLRKLEQGCSIEERMEIGRRVLERIVLLGQPYYFICRCLDPEQIYVTDALAVSFRYTLEQAERYGSYTGAMAAEALERLMRLLFADELRRAAPVPLEEYFAWLQGMEQFDGMEQYRRYELACAEIKKQGQGARKEKKGFLYRLGQLAGSLHKLVKRWLLPLIFAGVFLYMAYNIYLSFQSNGYVDHFQEIGTVEMKDEF